jgi:hypothetical protein
MVHSTTRAIGQGVVFVMGHGRKANGETGSPIVGVQTIYRLTFSHAVLFPICCDLTAQRLTISPNAKAPET